MDGWIETITIKIIITQQRGKKITIIMMLILAII
jgi:predicted nucleic acid-binding Zn ribbon protein